MIFFAEKNGRIVTMFWGVYYDDIHELPLCICESFADAIRVKRHYEVTKGITCKIEVIEI